MIVVSNIKVTLLATALVTRVIVLFISKKALNKVKLTVFSVSQGRNFNAVLVKADKYDL